LTPEKSYQFRIRAENLYGISEPSPPSAPSQLMARPKPVLGGFSGNFVNISKLCFLLMFQDKQRRPIPNYDPYALDAINKSYGEQYGE